MSPRTLPFALLPAAFLPWATAAPAQEPAGEPGTLTYLDAATDPALNAVVSVEVSADGKNLYAASYKANGAGVFQRDPETGAVRDLRTVRAPRTLDGVTALRLSPDQRWAATAAFRSNAVMLFRRSADSGTLTQSDAVARSYVPGLDWAIDLAWSPDSRFFYVLSDNGAAVIAFRVQDGGRLEHVQSQTGRGAIFAGARGLVVSPDGRRIYVASNEAHTLVTLDREPDTGRTAVAQVLTGEGANGLPALRGAFAATISPDGRFVYTSAGRYRGSDAVAAFAVGPDGTLTHVQSLMNDTPELSGFVGGNEIVASADGANVYAVATKSGALAAFRRDYETGKLTHLQTLRHGTDGVGLLAGASGLTLSPDGRFVYVAAEESDAVAAFARALPVK